MNHNEILTCADNIELNFSSLLNTRSLDKHINYNDKLTQLTLLFPQRKIFERKENNIWIIWRTDQSNCIRKSIDGIHIKQFYSNKDTIDFIIDNKLVSIFLVIDKNFLENFPSIDDDLSQIIFISILSNENNNMSPLFTRTKRPIRIITDNIDDLFDLVLEDINKHTKYELCDDVFDLMSDEESTNQVNTNIIWYRSLLDCMIDSNIYKRTAWKDLIKYFHEQYYENYSQHKSIIQFAETYSSNDAIRWYTRDSLIY